MIREEKLELNVDGIVLRGKLLKPNTDKDKYPIMVVLHGLTGNMDEEHIVGVCNAAVETGYAALRFDQFGHGTSDGDFKDHNLMIWMHEAMRVIEIVRNWDFVSDIVLCGHSQGGLNTIMTGGMMADRIKALIPMSPAVNIVYGSRSGSFLGTDFKGNDLPESLSFFDHAVSSDYLRVARIMPLEETIKRYDGPVLLIHGTEDEAVPYQLSIDLNKQYKNSKLVTIDGDDHCYHRHLDEVVEAVKQFLSNLLNK